MDIVDLGQLAKRARDLKPQFLFDLDGTLVDTAHAVKCAYQSVGCEPPDNFFGRPWREWLSNKDMHDRKNHVYPRMLDQYASELPALKLFRMLPNPGILTGASANAATVVLLKFNIMTDLIGCEMTLADKIQLLNALPPGIMFEDDNKAVTEMRIKTKWTIYNVHS